MKRVILAAVAAALIAGMPSQATAMKVEPGKWQFKSSATMVAGPPPKTNMSTECIDDGDVDPNKFMEGDDTCRISDVSSTASKLTWKMTCPSPQGTMTGDAVHSRGNREQSGRRRLGRYGRILISSARPTGACPRPAPRAPTIPPR